MGEWSFFTNHAVALGSIATDPDIRLRDIATAVGITERAAHRLVCDLVEEGYVTKRRVGRNNSYVVNVDVPLRRPEHQHRTVGELLAVLTTAPPDVGRPAARPRGKATKRPRASSKAARTT